MTLTKEAEALLGDLADIQETRYDVAFRWVSDALERIIAAVRAEQAAEVERLRAAARLPRNFKFSQGDRFTVEGVWVAVPLEDFDALRAALAATPVAPAPAEPRP